MAQNIDTNAKSTQDEKDVQTEYISLNYVLKTSVEEYLSKYDDKQNIPLAADTERDILNIEFTKITAINDSIKDKNITGKKLQVPNKLDTSQIAMIMAHFYNICTIQTGGEESDADYDLLAIYEEDGPNTGIYLTDDNVFRKIMRQYDFTLKKKDFLEVETVLRTLVERKERCKEKNLIAVNNGIFDYDTKELLPFDPEKAFISKSKVNYNPNAANPHITNPDGSEWDIESWMNDLSDDPEIVDLLWKILGAIIRPLVPWNKSAWLYSETGNNGKGTLCELMRNLVGKGSYASIPLASLGQDFMLEPLTRASCIIVDENDVGGFIDRSANLKSIITNDVVQINRKFKTPIAYQFYGFMVQCLNEMPRVKDKSSSFFRRQLFVPFTKCFTGHEKKYIKSEYMHRTDVLEYVMFKVLNTNYYSLPEPQACKMAIAEYKEYNDPVRQFADEILPVVSWDMLPFRFLYDLYKSWFEQNQPSGRIQGSTTFINDLLSILPEYPDWYCSDKKTQIRINGMMSTIEPLLDIYKLTNWMNPAYANNPKAIPAQRCTPSKGQYDGNRYRGLIRVSTLNAKYNSKED